MTRLFPPLLLLPVLVLAQAASAQTRLPAELPIYDVQVTSNVVFGSGAVNAPLPGNMPLLLDLYEPQIADRAGARSPAVLIIHGGGFVGGSRLQPELVRFANGLAARGHVVASIDYRLEGDAPVPSERVAPLFDLAPPSSLANAVFAAIDDGLTALDWLVANAESLSIDPDQIGLLGGSAGAVTSVHLAYVIDNFGIAAPPLSFVVDFWGGSVIPPEDPETAAGQLDAGEAALFAVHGTADPTVSFELSELLVARAENQGVPVEFHPVPGAGHGFGATGVFTREIEPGLTVEERMYAWVGETLAATPDAARLRGAWFEESLPGQGYLVDISEDGGTIFVAWFTFDAEPTSGGGLLPGAGQRWFTAQGTYANGRAELDVFSTEAGIFNEATPVTTAPIGTMEIEFSNCNGATLSFDLPGLGLADTVPIAPLLPDASCEP